MSSSVLYNPDILPLIFQWFDVDTLRSSRLVCKLWNEEATKRAVFKFPYSWFLERDYYFYRMNLRRSPSLPSMRNICLPGRHKWNMDGGKLYGILVLFGDQIRTLRVNISRRLYDETFIQFKFPRPYSSGDNLVEDVKRLIAVTQEECSAKASKLLENPLYKNNCLWHNVVKLSFDWDIPTVLDLYVDLCVNLESVFINADWTTGHAEKIVPKFRGALEVRLGKEGSWAIIPALHRLEPRCYLKSLFIYCQDLNQLSNTRALLRHDCCSNLKSLEVSVDWKNIGDEDASSYWLLPSSLTKLRRLRIWSYGGRRAAVFLYYSIKAALDLPQLDFLDVSDSVDVCGPSSVTESQELELPPLSRSLTLRDLKLECCLWDQEGFWDARLLFREPNPWPNLERLTLLKPTAAVLSAVFETLPQLQSLELLITNDKDSKILPWDFILGGALIPEPMMDFATLNFLSNNWGYYLMNLSELKSLKIEVLPSSKGCACWRLTDFFITDVLLPLKQLQCINIKGHKFTDVAVKRLREEFHPFTCIILKEGPLVGTCSEHSNIS